MRFFLVDRITEWKSEGVIRGVKNVAMSEDYLEFHFPGRPVMPGVLLLEAMAQLAGWIEAATSGFQNWVLVHKILKCGFYDFVFPGDQVELEVRCLSLEKSETQEYQGIGKVGGKKKIAARFEAKRVLLSSLEDVDEQKRFFHILTGELNGLSDAST